jgi:isopenicillin-N epimerase
MIGSLVSLPLPDGTPARDRSVFATDPLQDRLLEEYAIEVPVVTWPEPPRRLLRVSAGLYNDASDYDRLAAVLERILPAT